MKELNKYKEILKTSKNYNESKNHESKLNKTPLPYNITINKEKYNKLRQQIHKHPEIGFEEVETKKTILEFIKTFNNYNKIKVTEIEKSGFFIDIIGEGKEKYIEDFNNENPNSNKYGIAFRTDLDALPLKEETNLPYTSIYNNTAHSCGHDGHITILTCFLEYLLNKLTVIPSNLLIRLIYQPAEEGDNGAKQMIKHNCLKNINEIYGLHNLTLFGLGEIGVIPQGIMAAVESLEIIIIGKGGHGSTPHNTNSPIICANEIISKINQIPSQMIDNIEQCVVSVGCVKTGDAGNVIPDKAVIKGTIRTFKNEVTNDIKNIITRVSTAIGKLNNCSVEVKFLSPLPVLVNNQDSYDIVLKAINKSGFSHSKANLPLLASEDFSMYVDLIPGCFFMLGCRDNNHLSYIHSPDYDYNDEGTPYGTEMFIRILEIKLGIELL